MWRIKYSYNIAVQRDSKGGGKAHRRLRKAESLAQIGLTEPQFVDRPTAQRAWGANGFGLFS
jgi:hypothetical protein